MEIALTPDIPTNSAKRQVDECYFELRRLVTSCEIAPGTRLTEKGLIERLGYGRTPVREALLRLDQDRLIDTMPRSGYRVRMLTHKSLADFFAVWRSVAPLIAKLGVAGLTDEDRRRLVLIGSERDKIEDQNVVELSRIASSFFEILVKATNNEPLMYIYNHIGAEMERIYISFFRSAEGRRWLGSGSEIAAFANVNDPDLAYRLIEDRVIASQAGFLSILKKAVLEDGNLDLEAIPQS